MHYVKWIRFDANLPQEQNFTILQCFYMTSWIIICAILIITVWLVAPFHLLDVLSQSYGLSIRRIHTRNEYTRMCKITHPEDVGLYGRDFVTYEFRGKYEWLFSPMRLFIFLHHQLLYALYHSNICQDLSAFRWFILYPIATINQWSTTPMRLFLFL